MKNKHLLSISTAAVLSFLLSYGGISCLVTAFSLDVSLLALAISCGICCVAGCTLFHFRRGGSIVLCILALLGGYLWQDGHLADQTLRLGYIISSIYNRAYGWGYLGNPLAAESVLLPLAVLSGLIALLAGFGLMRRCHTTLTALFSILPLGLCLVVTDTVPDTPGLFLLLLGLLLLLFTQSVRKRSENEGIRLTWLLSAPVALALALLFVAVPRASYDRQQHFQDITDTAMDVFSELPYIDISDKGEITLSFTRDIPSQVNLQSIGPNSQFSIRVMEVTAESSGKLYLRGRHYDTYTGTQWQATEGKRETFVAEYGSPVYDSIYADLEPQPMGNLGIRTFGSRSVKYLPYYPGVPCYLLDGASSNTGGENEYTHEWFAMPKNFEAKVIHRADTHNFQSSFEWSGGYLQLPVTTTNWAHEYLWEHLPLTELAAENICTVANAIADLVRNSASYDLDTQRMPDGEQDFARWFLENSETGYCVHYATATAVLLRSIGIPARYVEGYATDAVAGETVTVTEKDAHAWVEYYIGGIGWVPLESTASATADPDADIPAWMPDTTEESNETTETTTAPQEETIPADSSTPTIPAEQHHSSDKKPFRISSALIIAVCLAASLLIQWPVRIIWRNYRQNNGSTNARVLKKWQHTQHLSKLLGQAPPEELLELALRAKFSQHTLTDRDIAAFDAFHTEAIAALRHKPWWLQVYYRLFRAAY